MLKTLRAPPKHGSLQESVLTLLHMKLETIEHARFRALSQIIIDKEKGVETFEEYMKLAFPYLEAAKLQGKEERAAILKRIIEKGPFAVRAIPGLKSRVGAKRTAPVGGGTTDTRGLYKKLGRSL